LIWIETYGVDKVLDGLVRPGQNPCEILDARQSSLQVLDALNDSLLVEVVVEIRRGGDNSIQRWGNGHATAGDGASSKVLAHGHGVFP